jgi:uncharacterized protein (DUF4415 family)
MEDQTIEQRLERVKLPEIELQGHKTRLRRSLLLQHARPKGWLEFFPLWRGLTLAGVSLVVLLVMFFDFSILWQPTTALAKDIALRDPRVRSLIGQGAIIKDTQLADKKGYLLVKIERMETGIGGGVQLPQAVFLPAIANGPSAFLVEVDFGEKRVSEIKELEFPSLSLDEADKAMAKEISRRSEKVQKEIPSQASIEEIRPYSADLKLVKKGGKVEVKPDMAATIIYKQDGKKWQGTVNMGALRIETIEFLGEETGK